MTTITLDRRTLKTFRKEATEALNGVAKQFGLNLYLGTIHFTSTTLRVPLSGEVKSKAALAAKKTSPEKLVGRKFKSRGTTFTVVDFLPTRWKRPYLARNARGTEYIFTVEQVQNGLI